MSEFKDFREFIAEEESKIPRPAPLDFLQLELSRLRYQRQQAERDEQNRQNRERKLAEINQILATGRHVADIMLANEDIVGPPDTIKYEQRRYTRTWWHRYWDIPGVRKVVNKGSLHGWFLESYVYASGISNNSMAEHPWSKSKGMFLSSGGNIANWTDSTHGTPSGISCNAGYFDWLENTRIDITTPLHHGNSYEYYMGALASFCVRKGVQEVA